MASSLITKKTVRGDSSIEEKTEEIAAPPADIQSTVDAKHAQLHAADHGNGQPDEINVAGLSGELADAQPPKVHVTGHILGGSDPFTSTQEINVGKVKTGLTTERYTKNTTTVDATPIDLDAVPVAEGEVVDVEVNVMSRKADGSERGVYHLEGVFWRNAAGNVTQEGNTASLFVRRSTSSLKVELVADTTNQTVDVRITGLAASVDWEARIILTRLQG